jgi:hypothetical protein
MDGKALGAANGHSLLKPSNTASRLQSQCPKGLRPICALALSLALQIRYGYLTQLASCNHRK